MMAPWSASLSVVKHCGHDNDMSASSLSTLSSSLGRFASTPSVSSSSSSSASPAAAAAIVVAGVVVVVEEGMVSVS